MNKFKSIYIAGFLLSFWACNIPQLSLRTEHKSMPASFRNSVDSTNTARMNWKQYFNDAYLAELIDTALQNNQELNITLQEIEMRKNEIRARKGEYLPFVGLAGDAGLEKEGKFTRNGAVEEQLEIKPGKKFPEPLGNFGFGPVASWELDVWKKLRNAKKAAVSRYLASVQGKNFLVTNLIAEIAEAYYELMALDNLLNNVNQNIDIQTNALKIVSQQKESAKVSQLAVNRFEAQLLNTQNLQYAIRQRIVEKENLINFLTGRFPKPIQRSSNLFNDLKLDSVQAGIPSQLLRNRPDVRQAELELEAAKIDVQVARALFYPSFRITAALGIQAFNPTYLIKPESILYNLAGDMAAPMVNRNAIKAAFNSASAQQIKAVYAYQQAVLKAHVDVLNQLAKIENFSASYRTKFEEVEILLRSVTIANNLFFSARADYIEVLLTQKEALVSKMELIEIKMKNLNAKVNIYRALGGGWN